jgi:hypothetical protein
MGSRPIASSLTFRRGALGASGYVLDIAVMTWRVVLPVALIAASVYLSLW